MIWTHNRPYIIGMWWFLENFDLKNADLWYLHAIIKKNEQS